MTVVYAKCDHIQSRALWSYLVDLPFVSKPWMVVGDFNTIVSSEERKGGSIPSLSTMNDFVSVINSLALQDYGYVGSTFTWCNKHQGRTRMWQRLDRALVSVEWGEKFSITSVEHAGMGQSDHCPLIRPLIGWKIL